MSSQPQSSAPIEDEQQRSAASAERSRNVLIDAGAGTGKTSILVRRFVSMLAPENDGPAVPIRRMAAVTFTRRAAGELRLRIREGLLEALARGAGLSGTRRSRLLDALAGVDTAHVGTIHGFADRLLRLRPIEARLSPAYEIVEDETDLIRETFDLLLRAAETGTLAELLRGSTAENRAAEATQVVLTALSAGVRAESLELDYFTYYGLDGLIAGFIRHRDVPPADVAAVDADLTTFRRYARELMDLVAPLCSDSSGVRWLKWMARQADEASREDDPVRVYRLMVSQHLRLLKDQTKERGFGGDERAYRVFKAYVGDDAKRRLRDKPLRGDLLAPLKRWMATRLVRLFPVVIELYERVKQRHQALDQVDLLIKLRDLLARDLGVRGDYQSLFDHIFVDEFQDTDPLQAEIILYLCEREPRAAHWQDVRLADGKLTVVGDPKQSIYRFRRADIGMYDEVRRIVDKGKPLSVRLSVNFRSAQPLVSWFNDRFEQFLGPSPASGRQFDPKTGEVFHQPLGHHRPGGRGPHVQILPFELSDRGNVGACRALEAEAVTRYVRWLVDVRRFEIHDPITHQARAVDYGDIAVLALSTPTLAPLFAALDIGGVPYSARGGRLFLQDHLHRQFLLGLRAVADRDDGVAAAALLRPPFFAVDLVDLVQERTAGEQLSSPEVARARAAIHFVRDLRRRRFERCPGATARDLLEQTAMARSVALGPNGAQRLQHLRELCLVLEQTAATEGLDYDAVTARLRDWVNNPLQLDPPRPVGAQAVQIMTVHQAKGLEFPVVILWDGRCPSRAFEGQQPWRTDRNGTGWATSLQDLNWEEPTGLDLAAREKLYADAERKRVVYVAATRARDLLVVPKAPGAKPTQHIYARLSDGAKPPLVEELEPYRIDKGASWADAVPQPPRPAPADVSQLERDLASRWAAATQEASKPRFQPVAVTGEAKTTARATEEVLLAPEPKRAGRYGEVFGETVHRAIGIVMREPSTSPADAVAMAMRHTALDHHVREAAADVARAIDALRREGLLRPVGPDLRLEYPLAGLADGGKLLVGYADLVSFLDGRLDVIDFKTDRPPLGALLEAYPEYAHQVRTYRQLAEPAVAQTARCGLLFSADGRIHWID